MERPFNPTPVNPEQPDDHEHIRAYKPALEHVVEAVEGSELAVSHSDQKELEGEYEGSHYTVKLPHLRAGKHAFVGLVDITGPDQTTFSCVIRDHAEDAAGSVEKANAYPAAKKYLPEVYGVIGKWAVIERLRGAELQEVKAKLKTDPEFLAKYIANTHDLISEAAAQGLTIDDVSFEAGHNTMINEETAAIRLIEQGNLKPAPNLYGEHEIITRQLFSEMEKLTYREPEEYQVEFAFGLLRQFFTEINPEDLHVKSREINITHPGFRNNYYLRTWKELPEEQYNKWLDTGKQITFRYGAGQDYTLAFTPQIIAAVQADDKEAFKRAMNEKKFRQQITDKNDPRFPAVLLPDPPR